MNWLKHLVAPGGTSCARCGIDLDGATWLEGSIVFADDTRDAFYADGHEPLVAKPATDCESRS